jgi:hypothetical protein
MSKNPALWALRILAGLCGAFLVCRLCDAGELPAAKQAIFLARVIAYDANLKARAGPAVNIAILAKKGDTEAEKAADAVMGAFAPLEAATVLGLPVKVTRLGFTGREALDKSIREGGIDTLYVCGGLDSYLADVRAVARSRKVLTMASREVHLKQGLSLGVFLVDGKNTIMVNLDASREEGVAFGPELLRLATVVR